MSEAPEVYTIGDRTAELVFRSAGITDVSDLQKVLDQVEVALKQAREEALREAAIIDGEQYPMWADVQQPYAQGYIAGHEDFRKAICALITKDADNG